MRGAPAPVDNVVEAKPLEAELVEHGLRTENCSADDLRTRAQARADERHSRREVHGLRDDEAGLSLCHKPPPAAGSARIPDILAALRFWLRTIAP